MDTPGRYSMFIDGSWVDSDDRFEIRSPATDLGPVISAEARDRILRYIDSGVKEGATLAYGGGVPAGPLLLSTPPA